MNPARRVVVLVVLSLAAAGCGDSSPGAGPPAAVTTVAPATTTPAPVTTVRATTTTTGIVPAVVGKDLATARALFAASGFKFKAQDGTQKGRTPADDWIVYRQSPEAGFSGNREVLVLLDLLKRGERYVPPGTSPCPRLVQC